MRELVQRVVDTSEQLGVSAEAFLYCFSERVLEQRARTARVRERHHNDSSFGTSSGSSRVRALARAVLVLSLYFLSIDSAVYFWKSYCEAVDQSKPKSSSSATRLSITARL